MVFIKILFVLLLLVPITVFAAYLFYKSALDFSYSRDNKGNRDENKKRNNIDNRSSTQRIDKRRRTGR